MKLLLKMLEWRSPQLQFLSLHCVTSTFTSTFTAIFTAIFTSTFTSIFTATFTIIPELVISNPRPAIATEIPPKSIPKSIPKFNHHLAQTSPVPACPDINNRPYVVILDRPANLLPPLPEFLAIAAVPCQYLNTAMTFLGGFDNAGASGFRANQLRELGVDAVVHSFNRKLNDVPAELQASVVLVELQGEPNFATQQVRSLTGRNAILATFNNRSVILAAPLSSPKTAMTIANRLRTQGLGAQVISAALISPPNPSNIATPSPATSSHATLPRTASSSYRVLVPQLNANTLKQVKAIAPDAFATIFQGKPYIQARTYSNLDNANRERDRLNIRFPGTIIIQD